MQVSKLQLFSVGYVSEHKKLSSKNAFITPVEVLPYLDGELDYNEEVDEISGVDYFGNSYSVKASSSNSLEAEWYPLGNTNRQTAPDLRRGMMVILYRYADADKYYWVDTGVDHHLMRLETVRWVISNTKDESTTELTPENSYWMEFSSHLKLLSIGTSKSDGEPFAYNIQLNLKEGVYVVADDDGNYFEMDSGERRFTFKNKDGSIIEIDKGVGRWFTPDSITHETNNYFIKCKNYNLDAKESITETTKTRKSSGDTNTVDYSKSTFTRLTDINGLLTLRGGIAAVPGSGGGATAVIDIPVTVNADTNIIGQLINNNIVFGTHAHPDAHGGNTGSPFAA